MTTNSDAAIDLMATELDEWATEYTEAAVALKALVLDWIRERRIVTDKPVIRELKRMEV